MCSTFSLEILRREAVPTVIALSQDVLWDVRAHICDELGAAGPLVAESPLLLMSLVDLTNDENCTVRAAAVNTLSGVVEYLQPEVMISVVTPLVLKFSKEYDLEVLQTIAKNIGKLCICLQGNKFFKLNFINLHMLLIILIYNVLSNSLFLAKCLIIVLFSSLI